MNKISGFKEYEIGGQVRPFKFGTNATALYLEHRGEKLKDFNKSFSLEAFRDMEITGAETRDLIWACLQDGARIKGEDRDFDVYDVGDWIDEAGSEIVQDMLSVVYSSYLSNAKKAVEKAKESAKKKPQSKPKTKASKT